MIRTNDIVRILTVAATVFLPLVAVSSVYGLNVDLPLDDSRWSFAAVMALTGFVSIALLVVFRLRRWP
jgi:magnesium transporter